MTVKLVSIDWQLHRRDNTNFITSKLTMHSNFMKQ